MKTMNYYHSTEKLLLSSNKEVTLFYMPETLIKSRHNPKHKTNSRIILPKVGSSTNLPLNLQNFKNKLVSGNGFIIYKYFHN